MGKTTLNMRLGAWRFDYPTFTLRRSAFAFLAYKELLYYRGLSEWEIERLSDQYLSGWTRHIQKSDGHV